MEINNLLYINANLNNDLGSPYNTKFNNITECCFDRAKRSDVQLRSYVDPDLMEQIASKYKNEKKKFINLVPNDKKKYRGERCKIGTMKSGEVAILVRWYLSHKS